MGFDCVLQRIASRKPRRVSPEWGCGGVFGLTYTGETLYYTLAFDAEAFFYHSDCSVERYGFELVGRPPRSGGDTYNAATWVDEYIYFGGWVHAPARFRGSSRGVGEIAFSNKYSHLHEYSEAEKSVRLLWLDRGSDERYWVGEVTGLLYNPLRDSLLLARGDGHANLGVYEVSRSRGEQRASRISSRRVLRGAIYMDHACFVLHEGWGGEPGVVCLDLEEYREELAVVAGARESSVDGGGLYLYRGGDIAVVDTWLLAVGRGGVFFYDPFGSREKWFARLLDFHYSPYGPLRSNALSIGGGLLVAFNASAHSTVAGTDELPVEQQRAARRPPGQTLLVYLAPPVARVVGALGARVTSMALAGQYVLVATSSCPNLERYDAVRVDFSEKSFMLLNHNAIYAPPPPLVFALEGWVVGDAYWGGIPLTGYREAVLELRADKSTVLETYMYSLYTRPGEAMREKYSISPGRNQVDLASARSLIVSFRLRRALPKSFIRIMLN